MTPKEKAEDLYTKFQVYYDDESLGLMPDDLKSKYKALDVCTEILSILEWELPYKPEVIIEYWHQVEREIKKL